MGIAIFIITRLFHTLGLCHPLLRVWWVASALALLSFSAQAQPLLAFAAPGGVVLGSFSDPVNAERAQQNFRAQFSAQSGLGPSVADVQLVRSGARVRVVAMPAANLNGRDLLARLRSAGFDSAWYLAADAMPGQPVIPPGRVTATYPVARDQAEQGSNVTILEPAAAPRADEASVAAVQTSTEPAAMRPMPVATRQALGPSAGEGQVAVYGSEAGVDLHQLAIKTWRDADVSIVVDGRIDEDVWGQTEYFDNMLVAIPALGVPGEYATQMRILATEKGLYVSSDMEQPVDTLVERLSRRDDFIDRDVFGITVDVSGEATVGYWFFIGLGDSLSDGKVLPERRYQRDWDGPWLGKSARTDTGWSVEMFLPWSMMNMPKVDGVRKIGFLANRNISHANERYQWPGYGVSSSRFVSALNQVEVTGVQPRAQMSVIPFAAATVDEVYNETDLRVGADFSWKPSPSLELSATANPDFGAVEADDVVLNLTASETFFPEKRLFFLEGNEVFSIMPRDDFSALYRTALNEDYATTSRRVFLTDFVPVPVSLLNTRRIGGTANQLTVPDDVTLDAGQNDVPTDLLGATKVTGTVGGFRYGALAAVEDEVSWLARDASDAPLTLSADGRDFGVARLVYEGIPGGSVGYMGTFVGGPDYDATVHSVDAHLRTASGKWLADAQFVMSDRDEVTGYGAMFDVMYAQASNLRHKFEVDLMDENVNFNDLGFLLRNDYAKARYVMLYNRSRLTDSLTNMRTTVTLQQQYSVDEGLITDSALLWRGSVVLPGRNTARWGIGWLPERYEDIDSRGNGAYLVDAGGWLEALVSTDASKTIALTAGIGAQQEHLGDWTYAASLGMTIRPIDSLSLDIDLRYKDRSGWLVYQDDRNFGSFDATEWQPSLNVDWFIAPGHQLRWNMQWAGVQAEDVGYYVIPEGDGALQVAERTKENYDFNIGRITTQLRYRWEIAPLTDFYLVYNRGNSIKNELDTDVSELFEDSLADPVIDSFIAKLRYRFGN